MKVVSITSCKRPQVKAFMWYKNFVGKPFKVRGITNESLQPGERPAGILVKDLWQVVSHNEKYNNKLIWKEDTQQQKGYGYGYQHFS